MDVTIDGNRLTAAEVSLVASGGGGPKDLAQVLIAEDAKARLKHARQYVVENWLREDANPIYGFNTGLGRLKDTAIPLEQIKQFQKMLVHAHSAGIGDPFPEEIVRAIMLLRANALVKGCSGPRLATVQRLVDMLNGGVHPVIPRAGSVGASGDLAPLAYLTGCLVGHERAEAFYEGERMPARIALTKAGISPQRFELEAKDGLALINGTTVSLALALAAAGRARMAVDNADIALALSLEAMRCETTPFDARVHDARPHRGQIEVARNVRALIQGSQRCTEAARQVVLPDDIHVAHQTIPVRVQDAYSLRCAPQVHGPVRDALAYVDGILATEINAATDNPLIFERQDGRFDVVSQGNFHGQYISQAMDLLAMAVADLGSISERRSHRMLDPTMSYGLPSNLVATDVGVNYGYAIAHCSMAALVAENKTLCWPAGIDSIPTKGNQEDHVSNSTWCARKAIRVADNVLQIIGTEFLMASQAISVSAPHLDRFQMGAGSEAAYARIRETIPAALDGDRWLHADLDAARNLSAGGAVRHAAEQRIGFELSQRAER
jgi:histidine ammonia-lyase